MDIEAVKRIILAFKTDMSLKELIVRADENPFDTRTLSDLENAFKQICQLFPKTPDNPDGFEAAPRPRVVCLCGSGRFKEAFEAAEYRGTIAGHIVLTIGCNAHDIAREKELRHIKPMLGELHLRKIDMADEVFVLNVDGYIGESTSKEIAYARSHNKPIRYLETSDNPDGYEPQKLSRKEFLALPIEKRRELLEQQASNPKVIAYYESLDLDSGDPQPDEVEQALLEQIKPSESRLLSKEKIRQLIFKTEEMLMELSDKPTDYNREEFVTFGETTLRELLEAQRDLTSSIKEQKCQQRVEGIRTEIFNALCRQEDAHCFDWVLSPMATSVLYQIQSDGECKRMIWSIIERARALKKEEGI